MVQAILGGLNSVLTKVFMPIINAVLKVLTKYVIAPLLNVVINIISYFLGYAFYGISIFLLALIDYAELIFRLLAGLEVDGMRLTLDGGKDGSSDLLVQLLRSEVIQQAFLSMVIVGIFLLVITTIFQMIKVEYTTEGSKNAKGPILNKAFKGVATLMMLPLLTIFGVFMGNQILGLIDTATKGGSTSGDQPTISGTLFTTAACEAYYEANEMRVIITNIATAPVELLMNIIPIAWNSVVNAWGADDTEGVESSFFDSPVFGGATSESRDVVESGFICQSKGNYGGVVGGYRYYYIDEVTTYYDLSQINYLLLIFGSAMVIKTLYYATFGMVVRLFHCGILFVVSPMIIGISPINDGAFKTWTKNFIGKALSAYGVVIAMNVFFIVVKVLLSLDIEFYGIDDYMFGNELMVGLLKSIFVIGGCTMVEKFSKELGSYFGADDAVSAGKELEKATKDSVKNAVKTVGTVALVATGVGGAGMTAAKGIAGAIKTQGIAGAAKGGMTKLGNAALDKGQGIADTMGFGDKWESMRGSMKQSGLEKAQENQSKWAATKLDADQNIASLSSDIEKAERKMKTTINEGDRENLQFKIDSMKAQKEKYLGISDKADKKLKYLDSDVSDRQKDLKDFNDDANVELRAGARRSAISTRKQMTSDAFKEMKNLGGWGDGFKEWNKKKEDASAAAAKAGGDQGAQDLKNAQKIKSDATEQSYKTLHADSIQASNVRMQNLMLNRAAEGAMAGNKDRQESAWKMMRSLRDAMGRANGDSPAAEAAKHEMTSLMNSIQQLTGVMPKIVGGKIENADKIVQSTQIEMNIVQRVANEGRAKGLTDEKLQEYIVNALKTHGVGPKALEDFKNEIKKILEELKG